MSENRSKKRQRIDQDGNRSVEKKDDEMMMMMMMMNGEEADQDDEERRKKERERKRKDRQRRIEELKAAEATVKVESKERNEAKNTAAYSVDEQRSSVQLIAEPQADVSETKKNDEDDDEFDMFSSSVSPIVDSKSSSKAALPITAASKTDDWQDEEGYYKAVIGEALELQKNVQLKVMGVVGKGVFSTVLKCSTSGSDLPETVALKCIRKNETMSKAAESEVRFLQKLRHPHVVELLLPKKSQPPLEHHGHICMVFPFEQYNLRDVLSKFGKGVGLTLSGVQSYFAQLLSSLQHLISRNLIHADLKPDNILVSHDFGTVQLCDFGSAMEVGSADAVPTPYLVSRFYRAPEIILGMVPTPALDLWSIGVTVAELFLGSVLLNGKNNSDMLRVMMECLGPFSAKTLRHHLAQVVKYGGAIPAHFKQHQSVHNYLQQTSQVTANGKAVVKEISLQQYPTKPLIQTLLKAKSPKDSRLKIQQFGDLLSKVLCLDAAKRISVVNAMKHDFFKTS